MSNSLIDTAENNTKLVPELRFPEFENGSEWVVKELKEIFISFSGGTPSTTNQNFYGGNIPFIRSAEIGKDKTELFLTEEGLKNSSAKLVNKGDLLIALYGANSGDVAISKLKGAINQAILCMQSDYSNTFTFNFLSLKKNWIISKYIQGGQGNLSGDIVKSIKLAFPIKLEQEKIASCLSSLDELITATREKLEALQAHKKGLMQNLFPQEGQTVPKYRFPEFEDDEEWEEKKLNEISLKIMVGIASAATHAYRKSGIVLFRNQNIKDCYLDDRDILFLDEDYEALHKNKRLKSGDLLTARTGYPGTTCIVPDKYEGAQSFTTLITRPKQKVVDPRFLCFYINSETGQAFFESTKIGGGQKNVNAGSLSEMPVPLPSKGEQQKIASCLFEVDELIRLQAEKIENLILHKKGLMQGLFPKNLD